MSLATGRWKEKEIDELMSCVSDALRKGGNVNEGCIMASRVLYRSAGSCYQKFLYETGRLERQEKVIDNLANKAQDLMETIQQESSPSIVLETSNGSKTIPIPEGKKVVVTIEINYV